MKKVAFQQPVLFTKTKRREERLASGTQDNATSHDDLNGCLCA